MKKRRKASEIRPVRPRKPTALSSPGRDSPIVAIGGFAGEIAAEAKAGLRSRINPDVPPAAKPQEILRAGHAEKLPEAFARLERELAQTKAVLREIIQGQEAANEELTTLNAELDHRRSEIVLLNSDLTNLFTSLDIPIVILGRDHRIRRFSPTAESLFNLTPSDVGCLAGDSHFGAMYAGVRNEINAAIDNGETHERQMKGSNGRWLSLRVHPYRSAGKEIQGALITLVDVHDLRHASDVIEEQRQYSAAVIGALRESLLVLDSDLRVITANKAFQDTFTLSSSQIVGNFIYELGGGQWNIPRLHKLLEEVLSRDAEFVDFELDHTFPTIGRKMLLLNARRFLRQSDGSPLILLAIQDETLHKHAQHISAQLLRTQDEERRRFARELHDSTSQSLAALTMNMTRLAEAIPSSDPDLRALLAESQQLAESSIKEIRTVTYLLHPPLLEEMGLASAIRTYSTGFAKRSGIRIDLNVPDEIPRLPRDMELALFRICQECLNNIHHHSGSDSGRIRLAVTSNEVVMTISDKGRGLGAERMSHNGGVVGDGVGIPSMQERARQFGGALEIDSTPAGTSIRTVLPLPQR